MMKGTKPKRTRLKKTDTNYINNSEFTKAVSEWSLYNRQNNVKMPMTDYMAVCILKLVNNFAHKRNFSGYTYIDDMKSEALITCVKYAHNFNPDKSDNAFAYFTQIIKNAFRMYLNTEKNQRNIKTRMIEEDLILSKYNYNNISLKDESEYEF